MAELLLVEPIREPADLRRMEEQLRARSDRDYLLWITGIYTGLRVSDILKLRIGDLAGRDAFTLFEKKTGKYKRIAINKALRRALRETLDESTPEEFIFKSRQGGNRPISRSQAWRILSEAARDAGIRDRIGTHTMRKTFGYHYYQKTHDVATLMELFNHSGEVVTLRYIGITQDMHDKAMLEFRLPVEGE